MRKQHKLHDSIEELKEHYYLEKELNEFAQSTLKEDMKLSFQNEGLILNSQLQLIENDSEIKTLSSVIKKKTLVLRFSQLNCQVCIEVIKPLLEKLNTNQVIILADYTNKIFFKEFKKGFRSDWHFYKIDSLHIPIEELNVPYFFILDKNMSLNHVFIPHKEMLEHVKVYLESVEKYIY